jgi:hypothetical protein
MLSYNRGDSERVSSGGGIILTKERYIHVRNTKAKLPPTINMYLKE